MGSRSGTLDNPPRAPLHGYRGEEPAEIFLRPKGLTLAISREPGARGVTIARKVGELLGWQVFDQEVLDFLMVDETGLARLRSELPTGAQQWVESQLEGLQRHQRISTDPDTLALTRLVLTIAATGDVVIVGRGAGFLLPVESTLHIRVVAPFDDRVNYLAQSLRLSREDAVAETRARDARRSQFIAHSVFRDPADPTRYDAIVNSSRLGIEATAQFIGWALRTKQQFAELAADRDEDADQ